MVDNIVKSSVITAAIIVVSLILSAVLLIGCAPTRTDDSGDINSVSNFVIVEDANIYKIVYDKDTKVMYSISKGEYNKGIFTLLVNPDGSPKVYEGN